MSMTIDGYIKHTPKSKIILIRNEFHSNYFTFLITEGLRHHVELIFGLISI